MRWDIFSQPQGPVVPISLFGDAANQGLNAAKALPTPLTSIIQGGIQGYEKGQEIEQRANQIAMQEEELKNAPLRRELYENQIESADLNNQIKRLELSNASELNTLTLDDQKLKLENDKSKITQEKELRDRTTLLMSQMRESPQGAYDALTSGDFTDIFTTNPKLYESALKQAQQLDLPMEQKLDLAMRENYAKSLEAADRQAIQRRPAYDAAKVALEDSPLVDFILNKFPGEVTREMLPDRLEYKTAGTARIDGDKLVEVPKADYAAGQGLVDVFYKDNEGKFHTVTEGVKFSDLSPITKFKTESDIQSRKTAMIMANALNKKLAGAQSQPQTQATPKPQAPDIKPQGLTFSTWKPVELGSATINDPTTKELIKKSTKISDKVLDEYSTSFGTFFDALTEKALNPPSTFDRVFGDPNAALNRSKEDIGKALAKSDSERLTINNDVGYRTRYNDKTLAAFNSQRAEIESLMKNPTLGASGAFYAMSQSVANNTPRKATSVEDMYYLQNKELFGAKVNRLESEFAPRIKKLLYGGRDIEINREESLTELQKLSKGATNPVPLPAPVPTGTPTSAPITQSDAAISPPQTGEAQSAIKKVSFSDVESGELSPNNLDVYINTFSQEEGVDPDLIRSIVKQESRSKSKAVSPKGAVGYMQLMPDAAKEMGVDRYDPIDNLRGGIGYFAKKLKEFNGNVPLALAAYNAGSGAVRKHKGIPPFKETKDYVRRITTDYGRRRPESELT